MCGNLRGTGQGTEKWWQAMVWEGRQGTRGLCQSCAASSSSWLSTEMILLGEVFFFMKSSR